jgi:pimeloyl-ACP methyl ester carboxylesterase
MRYIDLLYTSDDGLKLYARDYPGPNSDVPCVLCLPGLTRNSKDFDELALELSSRYRVICPDQRGRGRSEYDPQPDRYRPERYVQDMRTLLQVAGVQRTAVIGTSLGGLMAILMVALNADCISAVVLNDVGPEVDPRGIARIGSYVGKLAPVTTWPDAVQRTIDINGQAFPEFTQNDWLSMTANTFRVENGTPWSDYDPLISKGLAGGSATPDLWPLFQCLTGKPTLVIRGELSDILSEETLSKMHQRIPEISSIQIERVGHAPTLNEDKARHAIHRLLEEIQ